MKILETWDKERAWVRKESMGGGRGNFTINKLYFPLCNNINLRNNSFSVKMSCKNYMQ